MEPSGSIFFYSLAVVLLLTPLYKAGARPLPVLLLELAAVALLFALALDARHGIAASVRRFPAFVTAGLAVLLFYPLLQLFPLPSSIWTTLPGHGEYASVLSRFGDGADASAWRAASLIPAATEYAWLALLPPLACMLSAMRLSSEQVARLLLIMSVFVGLEALLGLLQVSLQ